MRSTVERSQFATGQPELSPVAHRIADEAVAYIREHGLSAFQLRTFAPSIGTSHRMVLHYFGSKDRLLAEVFRRLSRDDMARFRKRATSARGMVLAMWRYYTAPKNQLRSMMYFDLLGTAFQRPAEFAGFLASTEDWIALIAGLAEQEGHDAADAAIRARTALAGWRGLLIELNSGNDRATCEQSLHALLDAFLPER